MHNNPMYIAGEGRGAGVNPLSRTYTLPSPKGGVSPGFFVELSHAGLSISGSFTLEWKVNGFSASVATITAPYYFRPRFSVPASYLTNPLTVQVTASGAGYGGEFLHYVAITYPREGVLGAGDTVLQAGVVNPTGGPWALVLAGVPIDAGDSLLVYDPRHRLRWKAVANGGLWYVPIPAIQDSFPLYVVRGLR